MIAWFLATAWARKLLLYGVVITAILLCLRWWGNSQWRKGQEAGRLFGIEEIRKTKQAEWKAKEESIAQAAAATAADRKRLDTERAALQKAFSDQLSIIRRERQSIGTAVNAVPDSERNSAIRAVLGQLAAQ